MNVDTAGRRAADAARAAVAPLGEFSVPPRPRVGARVATGVAVTLAVAAALLVFAVLRPSPPTVRTGPAAPPTPTTPTTLPPRPPPFASLPPIPGETPITSGVASDGKTWFLFIGGPSHDLCLGVALDRVSRPSTCGGGPPGGPMENPYRPLVNNDARVQPMVFGRVPRDVVSVVVQLADGRSTARAVIAADGGPYYAVEIPKDVKALAVLAYRADGTSVRYAVP